MSEYPWERDARSGLVVCLVRHGRTSWNAERRFLGRTDVPLDEVGLAQAVALGAALASHVDHVVSSPLRRALVTARAVGVPTVDPDLAELSQGFLEGLTGERAIRWYPEFFEGWRADPSLARVPGGESLASCQARGLAALSRVAATRRRGVVAAVTHQMVIATVTCAARGEPLSDWWRHRVGNVEVTALARDPNGWRVVAERVSLPGVPE